MIVMVNIVLAEDHHLVRQGVRSLLEGEPTFCVVGEVDDGLDVLDTVERLTPDILITDLALPGLNGLEITKQVSQRFPLQRVIILSMHANEAYVTQAFANGAYGYVLKDSTITDLVEAIKTVCQGERYLSPPLAARGMDAYLEEAGSSSTDPYEKLTPRERQILQLVAEGHTSASIASRLSISSRTVEVHRANVMRKLNLHSQAELIRYAIWKGVVQSSGDIQA